MGSHTVSSFLAGVIEGFYGPPWSQIERRELLDWMVRSGLNTYCYAPKDDLKHRALWRERYSPPEAESLRKLITSCHNRGIEFIYALGPGLDLRYSHEPDLDQLQNRLAQLLELGCPHFFLLFDDIPDRMDPEDRQRWGSLASAQCYVTNTLFRWVRERQPHARFFFCPTPYCGRMAERQLGGADYLETLGRELLPEIDVCWTGPEIISEQITVAHIQGLQKILRRKPFLWDNLHANDYDGRRFYCGPYAGRPVELKHELSGLLLNPNTEFHLNYVPIRTLGDFVKCQGSWDARAAYATAMQDWYQEFATATQSVALEDLILLGDCFYLPYTDGPLAIDLYKQARELLSRPPSEWGESAVKFRHLAIRLRDFCARLSELRQRPLFYALSRRLWELREELDLLIRYVTLVADPANRDKLGRSDFHLPGTYRGSFVARLQQLLLPQSDESFVPAPPIPLRWAPTPSLKLNTRTSSTLPCS